MFFPKALRAKGSRLVVWGCGGRGRGLARRDPRRDPGATPLTAVALLVLKKSRSHAAWRGATSAPPRRHLGGSEAGAIQKSVEKRLKMTVPDILGKRILADESGP